MLIDKKLLDDLTAQAKASSRLRMHYDLRDTVEDLSQRMLNALEPGTVIPVHRHNETSEEVIVLRGCVEEIFYDAIGKETAHYRLEPISPSATNNSVPAIHVPMGQYHSCKSLQSGSVIIEFKNGKYDPETTEDILLSACAKP